MLGIASPSVINFNIANLSNLVYWHDVSDDSTITETSNSIEQIEDKSGNNNHLVQTTAGMKPTLTDAAVNGLQAAAFDNTNDVMVFNTTGATFGVTTEATHIMVYSANPSDNYMNFWYKRDASHGWHVQNDASDDAIIRIFSSLGDDTASPRPSGLFDGSVHCVIFRFDDGLLDVWLDGTQLNTSYDYSSAGTDISSGGIAGSFMQKANGYYCESFMTSDAKSDVEIAKYFSEMSNKWGI